MTRRTSHHAEGSWELFAHDADIGVRGYGSSRDMAFAEAAYAMTGAITDPATVRQRDTVDIVCNADSEALLLYEWLNALVYEMSTRQMLFSRFEVQSRNHGLTARIWGEPVDVERHEPATEIKGATMTELEVARDDEGCWIAQCVVDV